MAGGLFNMALRGTGLGGDPLRRPARAAQRRLGADLRRRPGRDHLVLRRHRRPEDRLQDEEPDRPRLRRVDPARLLRARAGCSSSPPRAASCRWPAGRRAAGSGTCSTAEPSRRGRTTSSPASRSSDGLLARRAPPARLERRAAGGVAQRLAAAARARPSRPAAAARRPARGRSPSARRRSAAAAPSTAARRRARARRAPSAARSGCSGRCRRAPPAAR